MKREFDDRRRDEVLSHVYQHSHPRIRLTTFTPQPRAQCDESPLLAESMLRLLTPFFALILCLRRMQDPSKRIYQLLSSWLLPG